MNEFEDVVFDDEEFDNDDFNESEINTQNEPVKEESNDLTLEILKMQGINDPSKIKFEDENGTIIERSWDSLTREEQLNILSPQIAEELDLSSDEIDLINSIRESGMSVNDYFTSKIPTPQKEYKIDQLSDEDLYALDLLEKIGPDNITDEELEAAVNHAKQNESLFKKTVEGLRKEYIKLQEDEERRQQDEIVAQQQKQYVDFVNRITNEINNFTSFAGQDLELSKEDSERLAEFMLNLDDNGVSEFGKALQNTKAFTEAAFWILHKDEIISELNDAIQNSYKRGYNAAKLETTSQQKNKIVKDTMFDDLDDWE